MIDIRLQSGVFVHALRTWAAAAEAGILDLSRLSMAYLSDANERRDALPAPGVAIYGKSLLYLVSRALDDARKIPLLGMERANLPAFAGDGGPVHGESVDHLVDRAGRLGDRTRSEERGNRVGRRRVLDDPGDAVEHAGHQRAAHAVVQVVPPVADELPGDSGVLAIAQGALDEERCVLGDRKSTRLNSSHSQQSRMPSSA